MDYETYLIKSSGADLLRFTFTDDLNGGIYGLLAELKNDNTLKGGYIVSTFPYTHTLMVIAKSHRGIITIWNIKDDEYINVW